MASCCRISETCPISLTPRQKVISEIRSDVDRTRSDSEKNLFVVLDRVHELSEENIAPNDGRSFHKDEEKAAGRVRLCILSLPASVFTAGAGVKTNMLFFTKGGPTDRIWYYDLSDVKVGKKNPLTPKHFEGFFALLPAHADSERSWTVSIKERKEEARRQSDPLRAQAASLDEEAAGLNEEIKKLKKAKPVDEERLAALTAKVAELNKQSGELTSKAKAIEDGVYDLKAVNPNVRNEEDTRTPEHLIEIIEMKGREAAEALEALRAIKSEPSSAGAPAAG